MNIELSIQKIVFGGDGMGLVNGKVFFVEGALPGEKVTAKIVSEKKNFGRARLLEILEPSPARIKPPCPYVRECGGCQYQHLAYEEELRWKMLQIREAFERPLGLAPGLIEPIRSGSKDYGYRNSVTLHKTPGAFEIPRRLGFVGRDNRSTVIVDHCLLADERLQPVFGTGCRLERGEKDRTFRCDQDGGIVSSENLLASRVRVGNETLTVSSRGFFQNNLEVTGLIADRTGEWVRDIAPSRFIDLYAGVGTFSLLAAKEVPEIYCFEENPYSVDCLKKNFSEKGISLAGAFEGRVENTYPRFARAEPKEKTLVFMDPPRQGIDPGLAEFLSTGATAENIVYLACDPAMLVRDLKIMLSGGRWAIRRVAPFDMFPRTKHIETLVWLERKTDQRP